jgi:adenosylcobinamide-phosphate synthase
VALELSALLAPDLRALPVAVILDLMFGDPEYATHPVRLIGRSLSAVEARLRALGADGYGGGILLFAVLAVIWVGGVSVVIAAAGAISTPLAWLAHVFLLYSLLALGDLLRHGRRIETAARTGNLEGARLAVSRLVGRDTAAMDAAACRRAAVESLSENLTDGFASPLFWYALAGLPGIVLFKVVSTMDSMVGYKTPRYLRFGWCGARLDDVMNLIPARLTWLLLAVVALPLPGASSRKALRVGWEQHATLPGPNSGWSEAATAGAIQRRLVGPIRMNGVLVTDVWIGDPRDAALSTGVDYDRAARLIAATGITAAALAWFAIVART